MNMDDLIGKLLSLYEKKMDYMKSMSERSMSLEERKESNRTDIEYKKLENQLTTDREKTAWEKEKLTTTIKGGYDLEQVKNSGMLDVERLKNLGAKDRTEIDAASKERIAKGGVEAELFKSQYTSMTELIKAGTGTKTKITNPTTGEITESYTSNQQAKGTGDLLAQRLNLVPNEATPQPQGRNITGEAENANTLLQEYKKAGNTADATKFLQSLDPEVRSATLTRYQQDSAAAPVPGVIPPAAPVQPAGTVLPARPELQVVDRHNRENPLGGQPVPGAAIIPEPSIFQKAGAGARSFVNLQAENAAATEAQRTATAEGVKNLPGTIAGAVRSTGEAVAGAGREFMAGYDPEKEKKRQDALRRARGLTVGGL